MLSSRGSNSLLLQKRSLIQRLGSLVASRPRVRADGAYGEVVDSDDDAAAPFIIPS